MTNTGLHGTSAEDPEYIDRFEDENDPMHEYHGKNTSTHNSLQNDFRLEGGRNSFILQPHDLQRGLEEGWVHCESPGSDLRTTPPLSQQEDESTILLSPHPSNLQQDNHSPPPSESFSTLSLIGSGLWSTTPIIPVNSRFLHKRCVTNLPEFCLDTLSSVREPRRLGFGPVNDENWRSY